jgi:hypothetical protein
MPDPRRWGRREAEALLASCDDVEDLLAALAQDAPDEGGAGPRMAISGAGGVGGSFNGGRRQPRGDRRR